MLPPVGAIDTDGLEISAEAMTELLSVDTELFKQQLPQLREHLEKFGDQLPAEISAQFEALEARLA